MALNTLNKHLAKYLARNLVSLLKDPKLQREFLAYWLSRFCYGVSSSRVPGGARVGAGSFSEFHSLHCLMPTPAEFAMVKKAATLRSSRAFMVDVGANIGAWTLMMAKAPGLPKVLAFEPGARTFTKLQENVRRNRLSNVELRQAAVSDRAGVLRFQDSRTASVFNRIKPSEPAKGEASGRSMEGSLEYDVPSISLDEMLLERDEIQVDLMKIDVEGLEPLVLRGMRQLLNKKRVLRIYIELDPENLRVFGFTLNDIIDPLFNSGFRMHLGAGPDGKARWADAGTRDASFPSNGYFELSRNPKP